MLNRGVRARRQAPPQATVVQHRLLRRLHARFDDEGGGRQGVDERGRDGLNCHRARYCLFLQTITASARSILFFGTGEKRNRLEESDNKSTCKGAGALG